jgi:glycosyltransferase involved in cell wall biosynthesis
MKVAIVYDWIVKWGGAERILLALYSLYPEAEFFTSVYDEKQTPWASGLKIHESKLQRIPFAVKHHEWFPALTPISFESYNFDAFDLVVSVTSADAKGIITKPETLHICYCLTPTRYLWHQSHLYKQKYIKGVIAKPLIHYLQRWDKIAAHRPDYLLSISETVKKRIQTFYERESTVIYPPAFERYQMQLSSIASDKKIQREAYFLAVSRLVPYKRMDITIKACSELGIPLIVIGKGTEKHKLEHIAGPSVTFIDQVKEQELFQYYRQAEALICVQEEDFGLTMAECLHQGTPVIAFNKGGATEIIKNRKTGILINSQSIFELKKALKTYLKSSFSRQECINSVEKFNLVQFEQTFGSFVEKKYNYHKQKFEI